MLTLDIGSFLSKPQGAKREYEIDDSLHFDAADGLALTSKVTAHVVLLKLPKEIHVQIQNIHTSAKAMCVRCLSSFEAQIEIPLATREFLIDIPSLERADDEEYEMVQKETHSIDLKPVLREEILLHFPLVPVCFDGCLGLCDKCGTNMNIKSCSCPRSNTSNNPFHALRTQQ